MAASLNKAMVIGNLTRDPELRQTASGQAVCNIGVATNRQWKDQSGERQEQVEYHNIVAWGRLAEICNQYLAKGRKVFFEGRLQTRDWEGQDGVRRYRTEIVAENMVMLDRAPAGGAGGYTPSAPAASTPTPSPSTPNTSSGPAVVDEPAPNPDDEIKVEDIPF